MNDDIKNNLQTLAWHGWTPKVLSQKTGLTPNQSADPNREELTAIARALGVDLADLYEAAPIMMRRVFEAEALKQHSLRQASVGYRRQSWTKALWQRLKGARHANH